MPNALPLRQTWAAPARSATPQIAIHILVLAFFFSIGAPWLTVPIGPPIKLFQIGVIAIILSALGYGASRRLILQAAARNGLLFGALMVWALVMMVHIQLSHTYHSAADVLVVVAYFAFSVCFAALVHSFDAAHRPINFTLAGGMVLGGVLSISWTAGVTLNEVSLVVASGVQNGDPDEIIRVVFGAKGLLATDTSDFFGGLRHTVSICMLAICVWMADRYSRTTWSVPGIATIAAMALIIVVLQSRSTWLAAVLCLMFYACANFARRRLSRKVLLAVAASVPFMAAAIVQFLPIVLARVGQTQSTQSRVSYLNEGLDNLHRFGFSSTPVSQITGSSHSFIVDSGLSAGLLGFAAALALVVLILRAIWQVSWHPGSYLLAGLSLALVVRLFTAGSGLPGIGSFLAFSGVFYLQFVENHRQRMRAAGQGRLC